MSDNRQVSKSSGTKSDRMLENITVIDFETSGLDTKNDRVIEIAAVRWSDGKAVSSFSTLVQFKGRLPAKITEITGITDEDLTYGMDEETAFRILNRFLGGNLLVAHNAAFDLGFLHSSLKRLAGRSFTNPFIDTLTISRDRHFFPYKLEDMCLQYGVILDGAHRALNDVLATAELLKQLHAAEKVDSYINKLGYMKKYGPPQWAPDYAVLVPQENRYEDNLKTSG